MMLNCRSLLRGVALACGAFIAAALATDSALASVTIPLTVNLSEAVTVTGTPRIAVDVGGTTRYADYTSGSGTSTLTFTLSPQAGDVDLDGITVSSPIQLNSGTIKDAAGNDATLTFTPPNTSGIKINYLSLSLDFTADADGRYTLNGTAYNDLPAFLSAAGGNFARASTATYFDASGVMQLASSGTPRFDYDPVTHAAKGLLSEVSRTNLFLYSTRMDNAAWNLFSGTRTTGLTAPDGSTNGTTFTGPSATIAAAGYVNVPSTSMTYSIFAKYISGTATKSFLMRNSTTLTNFDSCVFNLQTGTPSNACTNWTMQNVGNGWYRLSYSRTTGISVGNTIYCYFGTTTTLATADSWGLWGAQLEAGPFVTSFIPTTSTTATRATETFSVPTASWYNGSGGSEMITITETSTADTGGGSVILGSVSLTGRFIYRPSSAITYGIYDGTNILPKSVTSITSTNKVASSFGAAGQAITTNNATPATSAYDGSFTDQGYMWIFTGPFNGYITKLFYYPTQVTNTQLQLLTQ